MRSDLRLGQVSKSSVLSLVLCALCAGCIPIVIPVDLVVAKDVSVPLGNLLPGTPFPPELASESTELCEDWPSMDALKAELAKVLGDSMANSIMGMVQITSVKPESVELTASKGDFGSVTQLELTLGLPDDSQVVVTGHTADGNAAKLVVEPTAPLDLVDLLNTYGGTHTCVTASIAAAGTIPDPNPVFDVRVKGSVTLDLLSFF